MKLSQMAHARWKDVLGTQKRLNPTFEGSADVGGADADLIVGRCLWDVKTTVLPAIERQTLYQLLGYLLLDYSDKHRIREVGFYFSRQGAFKKWPIGELLHSLSEGRYSEVSLPTLRKHFRRAARKS
jgi:hypothetical protein